MLSLMSKLLFKQNVNVITNDSNTDPVDIDQYGQSKLHKAACAGTRELAPLLIVKTFDINQGDFQGRTALHIAAAMDNLEGVELLLKRKAHIDTRTLEDRQTATHHAAKHNATRTLLYLCQRGANIQSRDHRFRTPLFLAVEYGHENSARILLDYGADIKSLDNSGQSILSLMMVKMPTVAEAGLNQLYLYNPDTKRSYYYLRSLEPIYNNSLKAQYSRRPMQFIVNYKLFNLAKHPVIQKFVEIKWNVYGHKEALTLVVANIVFLVSWSSFLCLLFRDEKHNTHFTMEIWLFLFGLFCICELLYSIGLEIYECFEIRRTFRLWQRQQQESLQSDLQYCSPVWPQEEAYLKNKLKALIKMKPHYRLNYWRFHNWIVYILLLFVICIKATDVMFSKMIFRKQLNRIVAIAIIPLWLRNLKYLQAFGFIGPFILLLHKIVILVLKYLFIFGEMVIAFSFAFWFIFQGNSQYTKTLDSLIFKIFQITIIHQYGYRELYDVDRSMTCILVCLLIFGSIICNNLLIAMLTKTFTRAQDELLTNLVIERLTILVQRDTSWLFYYDRLTSHYYICKLCMPLVVYDKNDTTASFRKRTFTTIAKKLHAIEVFLKTRMIDFKGIGGIRKRKHEERNLAVIEHEVNILQKKLVKIAGLREKKNQLLFLQLQIIFCLLERMKAGA